MYIDGANVFYTQKKLGWSIDWKKAKSFLEENYSILEYRYYSGLKDKDEKMMGYLKYLDNMSFMVITKPLKIIKIDEMHPLNKLYSYKEIYKSNFDVEITTDMIFDRQNIDEFILFSGDSDFEYLIKRLKAVGKKIIIFSSRKTLSWELKLAASKYLFIEDSEDIFKRK